MMNLGDVPAGSTLYVPFATYNSSGASVTISGLAVTDIEIYKNGSVTQRSSDAGYALLDTDGIDFDGITGIHGFSVDLSDNTDAGFYAAGSAYFLVVSAITVDSQTVNFVYYFTIDRANVLRPTTAGRTLDVTTGGNAGIDLDNIVLTNGANALAIQASGTLNGTHSSTTADLGTNAPSVDIAGMTLYIPARGVSAIIDSYNTGTGVATFSPSTAATLTNGDQWYVHATPKASTGSPVPASLNAAGLAADAASEIASAVRTELTTELGRVDAAISTRASQASLDTVDNFLDTEVAAILAAVDTEVAAILALLDDARGEPAQGAPPVNPDAMTKIDYLYKAFRNKITQTATELSIYADNGTTVDHKATVSDDATTFTRGELISGA